jgi:TolB-like protein
MQAKRNRSVRLNGSKCAEARARKGFSREHLATLSRGGLSLATIKRIEAGAPVYLDTARRFAALVEVPLEALLPVSESGRPLPPSEAPATIAVLPFEIIDEQGGGWFADGLVEDVITRLGRSWFPVIARSSTFLYREAGAGHVRADLGADYAIEGSVRRAAQDIRVTARLVETKTSHQLWASSYDRRLADVFAVQDDLVCCIVGRAQGTILERESRPLLDRDPHDLTAWELALRGSWSFHQRTRDGNARARELFEQALQRDPHLALGWYLLAMTHQRAIVNQWSARPERSLHDMRQVCAEFARHFPGEPRLHVASAYCDVYAGDRKSAVSRLREAIDVDPNSPSAYSLYGQALAMGKAADEAIEQFELALRVSPRDADLWTIQGCIALCHFVAERFDEMLPWAERAVQTRPDEPFPHGIVAIAHAYRGDAVAARAAVDRMVAIEPRTSMRGAQAMVASVSADVAARYLEGLKKAGLPD